MSRARERRGNGLYASLFMTSCGGRAIRFHCGSGICCVSRRSYANVVTTAAVSPPFPLPGKPLLHSQHVRDVNAGAVETDRNRNFRANSGVTTPAHETRRSTGTEWPGAHRDLTSGGPQNWQGARPVRFHGSSSTSSPPITCHVTLHRPMPFWRPPRPQEPEVHRAAASLGDHVGTSKRDPPLGMGTGRGAQTPHLKPAKCNSDTVLALFRIPSDNAERQNAFLMGQSTARILGGTSCQDQNEWGRPPCPPHPYPSGDRSCALDICPHA